MNIYRVLVSTERDLQLPDLSLLYTIRLTLATRLIFIPRNWLKTRIYFRIERNLMLLMSLGPSFDRETLDYFRKVCKVLHQAQMRTLSFSGAIQ